MWPAAATRSNDWRTKLLFLMFIFGGHFMDSVVVCYASNDGPSSDDAETSASAAVVHSMDTEKRATIIRRAFKQLLKAKSLPSVRTGSNNGRHFVHQADKMAATAAATAAAPPQYMLQLYEKYRRASETGSDATNELNRRGNTVRSILSTKGNINGNQMLVFNISGIHSQEEMLHGELHFQKRRKVKWHQHHHRKQPNNTPSSPDEYRMRVYGIASNRVTSLATIPVPSRTHGWQVYDVTAMVKDCRRHEDDDDHHLLGIKFEGLNRRRTKFVGIPLNRFVNLNGQPFLIVFSNDLANNTLDDGVVTPTVADDESDTLLDDEDYDFDYDESANDDIDDRIQATDFRRAPNDTTATFLKRFSRSVVVVHENGIQDGDLDRHLGSAFDADDHVRSNRIPQTGPSILRSRADRLQTRDRSVKTIPYPHTMTFGKKPKSSNNNNNNNRKLPKAWHNHNHKQKHWLSRHENDVTIPEVHGGPVCRKRKLVIDFADIGWGEWIISPKSFEAQYCSGSCPFPITKRLRPSNHATIQSIVHAIGLQPDVPEPCCVADRMASVTLLFFDEARNVVLKNYPSMTVESCACR